MLNPVLQAFIATCCAYVSTAIGAAMVFFTFKLNDKFMDFSYGLAAGVSLQSVKWSFNNFKRSC